MEMDGGGPRGLSAEAQSVFSEAIGLILSRWTALQAAVENEWGGRDSRRKADLLTSDIFTWFTQSREPLYIDDLENILDEAMLSLNTMTEDGSTEEVAEKLMIMHEECLEGNYQSVEKLRGANANVASCAQVIQVANENDDDDDDDEDNDDNDGNTTKMMVDVPNHQSNSNRVSMTVDESGPKQVAQAEDGWEVVSSRRNRGKKN